MTEILFYVFGATSLGAAILAVSRKNAVASAIWLVVMFFGLAANYVLLEAWFVAAVQILVYAGAIMVLFLFVIMLLDLRTETLEGGDRPRFSAIGVITALLFLVGTSLAVYHASQIPAADPLTGEASKITPLFPETVEVAAGVASDGSAESIGGEIFYKWLLAFEVTSILLLGAILGAVILTKRRLL